MPTSGRAAFLRRHWSLVLAATLAMAFAPVLFHPPTAAQTATPIQTVFVIVFENANWSDILGNPAAPYINSLLPNASRAEQYYNPPGVHPSGPNYLWMEAGDDFGLTGVSGITPSANAQHSAAHLVTELNTAGISWKAYQESMPSGQCPLTDASPYVVRHNPFVYFTDVTNNNDPTSAYCIAHVRPYADLAIDLSQNTVARYNFITPNICNDMHDCGVGAGDTWLAAELPRILASPAYSNGGAVFITWDEGEGAVDDGPIGMIALSPAAKGHNYYNTFYYTHSSLVLTLQEIFGVRPLLGDAAHATDLSDLFANFPAVVPSTPNPVDGTSGVSTNVTLQWSSSGANDEVHFGSVTPPPLAASGIATQSYTPATLTAGVTYYWQIVSRTAAGTTSGPIWRFTAGMASLPGAWTSRDVGAVGIAGSASYATGTFTVRGAGADIGGTADAFHFVSQPVGGDVQITARITSLQNTHASAKAGVTFRDTATPGSAHVTVDVTPGGAVEFWQRSAAAGSTTLVASASLAFPAWLRLTRVGSTVTAAVSSNGTGWIAVGSATVTLPGTVPLLGLAVTSHSTTTLTTATIDSVAVTTDVAVAPNNPSPFDGATGVSTAPTLTWTAVGATSYDVNLGPSNPPPLAVAGLSSATYMPTDLTAGTRYFWRVIAHDSFGLTSGPIWSFTTATMPPGAPAAPNPASGATSVSTMPTLTWTANGATSYDVAFGTTNPPPAATTNQAAASYSPPSALANGATYYWQIVARNSAGSTIGPVWSFTTRSAVPPPGTLPAPWTNQDVGNVGVAGSAAYANGVFTVSGAGSDIWTTSDAFQFVDQPLGANGQIVARVTQLQNANTKAKAGVMVRSTLAAGSSEATLAVQAGGSVVFVSRASTGNATKSIASSTQRIPVWLKLTRFGSTVASYVSRDGAAWTNVGTTTVSLTGSVSIGLAVTSHSTSSATTATFDNVVVSGSP